MASLLSVACVLPAAQPSAGESSGSPLEASSGEPPSTGSTGVPGTTESSSDGGAEDPGSSTGVGGSTGTSGVTGSESGSVTGSESGGEPGAWNPTCDGFIGVGPCETGSSDDECNPYTQDCAVGSKCGFNPLDDVPEGVFMLHAVCLPLVGDKAVGEPCSYEGGFYVGSDDCGPASWCNNVDGDTLIGECVEQCRCDVACETPESTCQGSGFQPYCGYHCSPLLGDDACPEGWSCMPEIGSVTPYSAGVFTCKPRYEEPGVVYPEPCAVGWLNLASNGCEQLCDVEDPACDDGLACEPLESTLLTCPAMLGVCRPA